MGSFWPESGFDWVRSSEWNRVFDSASGVFWLRLVTFFLAFLPRLLRRSHSPRHSRRAQRVRGRSSAQENNFRGDRWIEALRARGGGMTNPDGSGSTLRFDSEGGTGENWRLGIADWGLGGTENGERRIQKGKEGFL
jgi:hypothetical protein